MRSWRFNILILLFLVFYLGLIFNIYNLQFEKRPYYLTQVASQSQASGVFEAIRGNIYFTDKNGNKIFVALNKEYPTIYAVPKEIENPKLAAASLNEIINQPEDKLEKLLSKPDDLYELLVQKAESSQLKKIKNLNLKGIYIKKQPLRFYPFANLASHFIGFVSPANEDELGKYQNSQIGRYGVESYFNELLSGKPGILNQGELIKPEAGKDLFLTIDRNIQTEAEEILKNLVEKYQAVGGTVIIQAPQTGEILAMGSYPNSDLNNYSEFDIKTFLNPAVQAIYEPGSVFKLITMAAGIDSGKITPETTYVDTGSVILNNKTIQNWDLKAHGRQTMTGVLEQSINTGAVFAQRQIGPDIFYNYLVKFGFNELTNINLPGEVRSSLKNLKNGRDIDFATASFGQGVAVTPIALINAISTVANGGNLMKPIILADEKPQVVRRVISSESAKAVVQMMLSAVEKNKIAAIPSYSVAGKTGTAFIPDFEKGGYTDEVINTYAGFAPAFNPEFVILIKLEKPKGAPLAGQTVVPAFRQLAEFILNYYNIPPDKL